MSLEAAKSQFKGFAGAVAILEDLSTKDQKRMLLNVMRKALKPVVSAARVNLGGESKRVEKAIRTWAPRSRGSSSDNPVLFTGVKSNWRGYGDPVDPWFAHIIEYGTDGVKKKKHRGSRSNPHNGKDSPFRFMVAKTPIGKPYRYAIPGNNFFGRAVRDNQDKVGQFLETEVANDLVKRIERKKRRDG